MQVSPHTALKHRMMGVYFHICKPIIKKRGTFYYVDLYAGDGEAECDESPIAKWDVPFVRSLLSKAEQENLNLHCYLNDFDEERVQKLKKKVAPYSQYISNITQKDANEVHSQFLGKIPPEDWSVWFLDPFKHSDLKFSTIKDIASHEAHDEWNDCTRKPELIINLMTLTMQRSMSQEDEINTAIGAEDSSEWKERIADGEKAYEVFSDIFLKNLGELGYSSVYFTVGQTDSPDAVLYYLIFASSIPKAQEILAKKFKPYTESIMREAWIKENFIFRQKARLKKKGVRELSEWF